MPQQISWIRVVDIGVRGPEDVIVCDSTVITGVEDGRILLVDPDSGRVDTLADTGGRPLGLEPPPDGRVLVCDCERGLLALDPATGDDGLIWITLTSPREPVLGLLHRTPLAVRRAVAKLPERLQPAPKRVTRVQAYDAAGRVVHDLEGPGEQYHMVTGVRVHQGTIYFGGLYETAIAIADAPAVSG